MNRALGASASLPASRVLPKPAGKMPALPGSWPQLTSIFWRSGLPLYLLSVLYPRVPPSRNPEGCQKVAGGRSASADPRKSGRRKSAPRRGPGGVPERGATSGKSNEPLRFAALSVPRDIGGLGKEAIIVLVPAAFLRKNGFWHPSGAPPGCRSLLTLFPGVYACAPTPGYSLATLRVAVEFGDAARGQTSMLNPVLRNSL